MYEYLLERYQRLLVNEQADYTLLINGQKKKFECLYPETVTYIRATESYIVALEIRPFQEWNSMEFALHHQKDFKFLLKCVMEFLTSESDCFYQMSNNILIKDFRNEILNIKDISIANAVIDDKMINLINFFFHKLNHIDFHDCTIKNNCSLNQLKGNLNFYHCVVESSSCFSLCRQDIVLENSEIKKITNGVIHSTKLIIDGFNDLELTNLFLKCHFPELEKLVIGNNTSIFNRNQDKEYIRSLNFLPYSTPNLVDLFIEGKIYSFVFLYHFKHLKKCEIRSLNDSIGIYQIYNPDIIDKKERDFIIKNSKRNIERDFDIHLAIRDKLQEIIKSLNTINFTEEEKIYYLNKQLSISLLNPLGYYQNQENQNNEYYTYDSINDTFDFQVDEAYEKSIMGGKLYLIEKRKETHFIKIRKSITTSKPFIYHTSGTPILFSNDGYSHEDYIKEALSLEEFFSDFVYDETMYEVDDDSYKKTFKK